MPRKRGSKRKNAPPAQGNAAADGAPLSPATGEPAEHTRLLKNGPQSPAGMCAARRHTAAGGGLPSPAVGHPAAGIARLPNPGPTCPASPATGPLAGGGARRAQPPAAGLLEGNIVHPGHTPAAARGLSPRDTGCPVAGAEDPAFCAPGTELRAEMEHGQPDRTSQGNHRASAAASPCPSAATDRSSGGHKRQRSLAMCRFLPTAGGLPRHTV
eukprot:TRINITY_DN6417_c0_g1_i1.p1 TRINITY_DN6417_c0_g1~~TRINITY_DN6417_c0_g1_i1.p1  ORF type:complete len:213 (+),score=11.56 TRINITY_DN6417_c0_g1_i1:78-716(+)